MRNNHIASICIFGSSARRNVDELSDTDVLIVSNDIDFLNAEKKKWMAGGWSVSSYTVNRIEGLFKSRSLFIQHLKVEGVIVSDSEGWLERRLAAFMPKSSYMEECYKSIDLIKPIERLLNNRVSTFFAADTLYVGLRNIGVNLLASKNSYVYDFEEIISAMQKHYGFSSDAASTLKSLRALKFAYRNRTFSEQNVPDIEELIAAAKVAVPWLALDTIEPNSPIRQFNSGYARIREIEAWCLNNFSIEDLDEENTPNPVKLLWRQIKNPNRYSWAINRINESTIKKLTELQIELRPHEIWNERRSLPARSILP